MSRSVTFRFAADAFDADLRALERQLEALRRQAVPQATARALTATANRCRTQTVRELARAVQAPPALVRKRVKAYRAFPRALVATVWVGTKKHIPIEQIPGAKLTAKGLKAGKRLVKVFKARMPSGHQGLYTRRLPSTRHARGRAVTSTPNLPIEHPVIRLRPAADSIIERQAREQMRDYFPRELGRLFARELDKLKEG